MSSKNTGSRIGGRVPVVLRRFCDVVFQELEQGTRREAYYLNCPHEKLVCVEDPVPEVIVEAMNPCVDGSSANRVLALEPCDNDL